MAKKTAASPTTPRRRTAAPAARTKNSPAGAPVSLETADDLKVQTDVDGAETRTPSYEEIAEAAYRRYLERGGEHGRDFDDWLEAERSLRRR